MTVDVEFRDPDAFRAAVEGLGWTWLGQGVHKFYSTTGEGDGFRIPNWRYPAVLTADGKLACDDASRYDSPFGLSYGHGKTADEAGKVPEFVALTEAYAIQAAKAAALAQGWYCEMRGADLAIIHPSGGELVISPSGTVDAQGFMGAGCGGAVEIIGQALGRSLDVEVKPEFWAEEARITL